MRVTMLRRYFGDTIIIEVWGGVLLLTASSAMRSNSGSGDSCSDGGDFIQRCDMSNRMDHDTKHHRATRVKRGHVERDFLFFTGQIADSEV
jgi:hypothetical protein